MSTGPSPDKAERGRPLSRPVPFNVPRALPGTVNEGFATTTTEYDTVVIVNDANHIDLTYEAVAKGTNAADVTPRIIYIETPSPSAGSGSDSGDSGSEFKPDSPPASPCSCLWPYDTVEQSDDEAKQDRKRKSPSGSSTGSPKQTRSVASSSGGRASRDGGSTLIAKKEDGASLKTGAWDGEEDYILFMALHPRASPSWAAVGEKLGRDAKSCQNRYATLSKKLPGAIKAISKN